MNTSLLLKASSNAVRASYRQARKVAQLVREWASGGHVFVPEKTPDGILRFLWENWNSLKVFTEPKPQNGIGKHDRIKQVDALCKRFDVDAMAGCELMCNWCNAEEDEQFKQFFGLVERRKGSAAHNTSPSEAHIDSLPGGTAGGRRSISPG